MRFCNNTQTALQPIYADAMSLDPQPHDGASMGKSALASVMLSVSSDLGS